MKFVRIGAALGAIALAVGIVSTTPGHAATPDAGLNATFQYADPVTGRSLNVLNYGATSNNSTNDDAAAFRSAIAAASPGDEVYIPDGVWHVKSTVNLKTGVSLRCQSQNSVLQGVYTSEANSVIYGAPGINNLTLSNCKITQNSGAGYAAGVRFGNTGTVQASRIDVQGMFVEKFRRFGIQLMNTRFALVDGNTIKNATALDGGGSGYGVIIDQSNANNNWVRNNNIGPVIRHAILIQFLANHNLVENNRVQNTVSGSIDLHGEDEYSNEIRYNTVSDCVLNGTSQSPNGGGIEAGEWSGQSLDGPNDVDTSTAAHDDTGPNNWIHHNEVYNCTFGFRIVNQTNNTYVEDNNFHNNYTAGIRADLYKLDHLFLSRNRIANNGNGVQLSDVAYATVQDNTIINNTAYGLWTNSGTTNYTITGNVITGNNPNVSLGSPNGTYVPGPTTTPPSTTTTTPPTTTTTTPPTTTTTTTTPPPPVITTVDDANSQWAYAGTWNHCINCNEPGVTFYSSSQSWSSIVNSTATLTFTGSQLNLYAVTGPGHGIGAVSVDGGAEINVDLYSAIKTGNVLVWTSPVLTSASHTFKWRMTGTKNALSTGTAITLDRADVLS